MRNTNIQRQPPSWRFDIRARTKRHEIDDKHGLRMNIRRVTTTPFLRVAPGIQNARSLMFDVTQLGIDVPTQSIMPAQFLSLPPQMPSTFKTRPPFAVFAVDVRTVQKALIPIGDHSFVDDEIGA